jgi:hypothetical protein
VVSGEGTRRRGARGDERKKGNRLFVADDDRSVDSDSDFVREQDPLRLEQRVIERAHAWQKRCQHDDGDTETGDRPAGPWHESQVL